MCSWGCRNKNYPSVFYATKHSGIECEIKDRNEGNIISFHLCSNNHQQPHWANLSLWNNASIYPPPLSLSLFPFLFSHLFSQKTQAETWIKDDRYIAGQKARTKGRTSEGGMEEKKVRVERMWGDFFFGMICLCVHGKKKKSTRNVLLSW